MIKIKRKKQPKIKVYTVKDQKLSAAKRKAVLKLLKKTSKVYGPFIPRLKDRDEKFTKAEKETLNSIAFYADLKNFKDDKKLAKGKGPNFNVYKDPELKIELSKLFNEKCAYCETKFLAVSPADIEHFRPKAAINCFSGNVDEKLIYPGYYWLAADWKNLLWSCIACNRKRNLKVSGRDEIFPLGKKNRFPVIDEERRIRSHNDDLSTELTKMLILDPCRDDPSKHFEYPLGEDDLGIIRSKIKRGNKPSAKAEASIPIYGLNRVDLVLARRETAKDLKLIFIGMLRTMEIFTLKKKNGENSDSEKVDFEKLKEGFKKKYQKDAEYLALKDELLEDFKTFPLVKKLKLDVNKLLDNSS